MTQIVKLAIAAPFPAGHGVHRLNRANPVGATPRGRRCGAARGRPQGAAPTTASTIGVYLRSPAFAKPASAGEGRSAGKPSFSAGHGVHRSNRRSHVGARCARPPLSSGVASIGPAMNDPRARAARPYTARNDRGSSAGHGVHRSNPQPRPATSAPPSRRVHLRSSVSVCGLIYASPEGMGCIAQNS